MTFGTRVQSQQPRRGENLLGAPVSSLNQIQARAGGEELRVRSLRRSQIRSGSVCEEIAGSKLSSKLQAPG
jgi:hypothetical protein